MRATNLVDTVMTKDVLSIGVDEPASEVLRLFAGYPVHHLPVVSGQKVVGMLSSADVMKLAGFIPRTGGAAGAYLDQRVQVATLMSKPVVTIRAHATLLEAARAMTSNAVHALPVVDEAERLVGIITTTDVMHAALQAAPPRRAASGDSRVPRLEVEISPGEFEHALAAAKGAIAAGEDIDLVAIGFLYLHRRLAALEHVLQSADRYLKFGQATSQLATLRSAIAAARRAPATGERSQPAFGLD